MWQLCHTPTAALRLNLWHVTGTGLLCLVSNPVHRSVQPATILSRYSRVGSVGRCPCTESCIACPPNLREPGLPLLFYPLDMRFWQVLNAIPAWRRGWHSFRRKSASKNQFWNIANMLQTSPLNGRRSSRFALRWRDLSKPYWRHFNPDVANAFFRAGMIEAWGRGIERIKQECVTAGVREPELRYERRAMDSIFFSFRTVFRGDYR